jgi:hypothetical protein
MTLGELFRLVASDLDGVEAAIVGDATEWRRGGVTFAVLRGDRTELRLTGQVGLAALGTPDTAPSERGPDWIAFTPRELDGMALDRAASWFENAARHAGN